MLRQDDTTTSMSFKLQKAGYVNIPSKECMTQIPIALVFDQCMFQLLDSQLYPQRTQCSCRDASFAEDEKDFVA